MGNLCSKPRPHEGLKLLKPFDESSKGKATEPLITQQEPAKVHHPPPYRPEADQNPLRHEVTIHRPPDVPPKTHPEPQKHETAPPSPQKHETSPPSPQKHETSPPSPQKHEPVAEPAKEASTNGKSHPKLSVEIHPIAPPPNPAPPNPVPSNQVPTPSSPVIFNPTPLRTPTTQPDPPFDPRGEGQAKKQLPLDPRDEDPKRRRKIEIFEQMFNSDPIKGYLEKDRLRALLEQMRINDTAVHEFLWKQYDTDGDGRVNFQEFCQMMFDVMDIKKKFENADRDNNKSISPSEIITVLTELGLSFDAQSIDAVMTLFDTNHDKGIDFSEFLPLSIFLTTLEYQYKEFSSSKVVKTKWLRPLLGGDIAKEEEITVKLEQLLREQDSPSMDAYVRIILSAASSNDFKEFKAPTVEPREEKEKIKRPTSIIKPSASKRNLNITGLFEDREFELTPEILPPRLADKIVWRRPSEISETNSLFVDGVEEGDVIQGSLGDCWFLGALAVVAASGQDFISKLFVDVQPEHGYYVVKFYKNGDWVEVTVDDRLPCHISSKGGVLALAFATCKDPTEFWVPIIEKAYAKLHGSFEALEGGSICDALKDLTGGAIETLRWKPEDNEALWDKLRQLSKQKSLMGCSIDSADDAPESKLKCGLLQNHAYSILKCKYVENADGTTIRLLRIRNPWGEGEWNGAWSDNAPEWTSEIRKKNFLRQYTFKDDGTFFMSFEDFVKYFNRIFVMRSAYAITTWSGKGEWRGDTAQGCRNNPYWLNNPQYPPTLIYETKMCPGSHKREYENIGLYVLKANDRKYKKMVCRDEDKAGASAFTGVRDTSLEFDCNQPGIYILVPCTYHKQKEARYNITIYTTDGKPVKVAELPAKKSLSLNGEWVMGSTAGGCYPNYRATFMNNPQYLLKCDSPDTVDVLLAQEQSAPNVYEPVGMYAFPANDDKRHEKNNRFIMRPEEMLESVSVSSSLTVDANEGYIIIPATMDPIAGKFAITVMSEHIKEFKRLY